MRLTIVAGLIMGLALGIHSVLGSRARVGTVHAEADHVGICLRLFERGSQTGHVDDVDTVSRGRQ